MYENIFTLENTTIYLVWILLALRLNYQDGLESVIQRGSEFLLKELAHPGKVEACKYYWNEQLEIPDFGLALFLLGLWSCRFTSLL